MTDQKLRELERKWKETGSVEDEAAHLRERVRVGDLTQERLELAAYCGHAGATLAISEAPSGHSSDFVEWFRGLDRWPGAQIQAAAEVVGHCVSAFRHQLPARVVTGHASVLKCLECPCATHAAVANTVAESLSAFANSIPEGAILLNLYGCIQAVAALGRGASAIWEQDAEAAKDQVKWAAVYPLRCPPQVVPTQAQWESHLKAAAEAATARWALAGLALTNRTPQPPP